MKEKRDAGRIVMLPSPTWKGVRRGPTITATGAIVTASSAAPEAAYRVFEWYMGEEPADGRARSGWGLPALTSKYELIPREGVFREQVWSVVEAELEVADFIAKFNPFLIGGEPGEVGSLYDQYQEQVLGGDMTFEEMIERMETETNAAIEEGKERIGVS
jgi:multiple sugar transport system substrate-binding protein